MNSRRLAVSMLAFALAACSKAPTSSGGGAPTGGGPTFDAFISVADYMFTSDSITISVGKTVEWSNNGPSSHTVTSDNSSWSSITLASPSGMDPYGAPTGGGTFTHMFPSAGTFHYHCSIHAGMIGVVVVTP